MKDIDNFSDKTVLITGGTGSFGNAVANALLNSNVKELRIFSRDEKKQDEMRHKYKNNKLKFYLGDVRDANSLNIPTQNVDYIFHAAALKQVPSCEFFPEEAVKTNILGSANLLRNAIENKVSRVVMLSTDKAVYPINAMGMSKALMEKIAISQSNSLKESDTVICITRYGNVMGSRGSVIPLFISLIKENKPLTITDPQMTRFLMSLDSSVDLVFYALQKGKQGDIYIPKVPACTISDLTQALKEIFNKDLPINIIGTRHGEKLYETLISREEMVRATEFSENYRICSDSRNLNYDEYFEVGEKKISESVEYTSHNAHRLTVTQIKEVLLNLELIKKELNV